jgi:hypothetical protein
LNAVCIVCGGKNGQIGEEGQIGEKRTKKVKGRANRVKKDQGGERKVK